MELESFLKSGRLLLLDGAMGTELGKLGLMGGGHNNTDNSDAVLNIHKAYVNSGSRALITNTLTMNRIYIETHNVGADVETVNLTGARLARQAAENGQYVLGNLSSTGQMLEPYGDYTEEQFLKNFEEQAEALVKGGVDGFIIETMFDLGEALCALKACKKVSRLPVLVSMAYSTAKNGGRTIMGNTAEECVRVLAEAGADAVGANCGELDPEEMAEIISSMHSAVRLPVIAEPNAGKPHLEEGRAVFDLEPELFARGVLKCIGAGAGIVGGCCGTSPEHIRALSMLVKDM